MPWHVHRSAGPQRGFGVATEACVGASRGMGDPEGSPRVGEPIPADGRYWGKGREGRQVSCAASPPVGLTAATWGGGMAGARPHDGCDASPRSSSVGQGAESVPMEIYCGDRPRSPVRMAAARHGWPAGDASSLSDGNGWGLRCRRCTLWHPDLLSGAHQQ